MHMSIYGWRSGAVEPQSRRYESSIGDCLSRDYEKDTDAPRKILLDNRSADGDVFFALSMTPTLLPRHDVMQGLISGLALVSVYGVGVLGDLRELFEKWDDTQQKARNSHYLH